MKKLKGIGVSPGIAIGPACRLFGDQPFVPEHRLEPAAIQAELARLRDGFARTRDELLEIRRKLELEVGSSVPDILNVQLLLLGDEKLQAGIEREIKKGSNAPLAVHQVTRKFLQSLGRIGDAYLKERKLDLEDLSRRIIRNLLGEKGSLSELKDDVIVVSADLTPSETASFRSFRVSAFATDAGGPTSHTAIMARALEIPAVVGLEKITGNVETGDLVIIDGREGVAIVRPDEETIREYTRKQARFNEDHLALQPLKEARAITADGRRITIGANIELPNEVTSVIHHGADEIGLFRTEFLYLDREDLPSEQEQFSIYRRVIREAGRLPVVIRTLDLGGDKFASGLEMPEEGNPFLGWRAIRFCLSRRDVFRVQLRAILRAGVQGRVRIMYPLVTDVSEVREANRILADVKRELREEGRRFRSDIPVGVMIEVPSAAIMAAELAREVAFFSIGTNDLIQYSLAIDRSNKLTAYLYNPVHPAVLRLIAGVVKAGREAGIPVSVCGEMAADPAIAFLLVGMGVRELSMAPLAIPEVKRVILQTSGEEADSFAEELLKLGAAQAVRKALENKFREISGREIHLR